MRLKLPVFIFLISGSGLLAQDRISETLFENRTQQYTWENRLVGDRDKPQSERFTKTNITIKKEWELMPSSLPGSVRLLKSE